MSLTQNLFKTISQAVPVVEETVYTTPSGRSTLVLTCQAVNTDAADQDITLKLVTGVDESPLIYEYVIPSKEVLVIFGGSNGKLVVEAGSSLSLVGSSNNVYFTLSVLEHRV
jgi:hypothetical protein